MSLGICRGMAVVIDNGIGEEEPINKIIEEIENHGIPTCQITTLDAAEKVVENLTNANFIILDWNMSPVGIEHDFISLPAVLRDSIHQRVIDYIIKIRKVCFAPVFLFTTLSNDDIKEQIIPKLIDEELYYEDERRNFILVRHKYDLLKEDKLIEDITKWVNNNPTVYLLKKWKNSYTVAENEIFWDLYSKSPSWPSILWDSFEEEDGEPALGINDILFRLIMARIVISDFSKSNIETKEEPEDEEIKEVLRRTMYEDEPEKILASKPGDIYTENGVYYLNLRPECDTVSGRHGSEEIYLINGQKLGNSEIKKLEKDGKYSEDNGFNERIGEAFLYFLDGKDIVRFTFKNLKVMDRSEAGEKKCRLLPPFITQIQQRYASYLGRFGTPRLPKRIEREILKKSLMREG